MTMKLFRALFETRDGEHEYLSYRWVAAPDLHAAHIWALEQLYEWFGPGTKIYDDLQPHTVEGPGAEYRLVTYEGVDQMTQDVVPGTDGKKYCFDYSLELEVVNEPTLRKTTGRD